MQSCLYQGRAAHLWRRQQGSTVGQLQPAAWRTRVRWHGRHPCIVQASGIRRLPIFPLGMVAFPTAHVPLTIFEARYRVLFSTLLAGDEGIDNDLVQEDSEFKGSRQFGMSYCSPQTGGVAEIGTILEVTGYSPFDDGRLLINTRGTKRFRILKVVQQTPVVIAECEILDEPDEEDSVEAHVLQEEVTEKFRAVWQLSNKIRKQPTDAVPTELGQLGPKAFSYWVAGMFGNNSQPVQQLLLQEGSIIRRLRNLSEMLDKHINYLRAAVALESLGSSTNKPSTDADDAGGGESGGGDTVRGDDTPQTQ